MPQIFPSTSVMIYLFMLINLSLFIFSFNQVFYSVKVESSKMKKFFLSKKIVKW